MNRWFYLEATLCFSLVLSTARCGRQVTAATASENDTGAPVRVRFAPKATELQRHRELSRRAISGREQCDPGQSILVAPIAGRYDEAGDRDRVAIAGARWDL
jgi:hypothetical protein